MKSILNTLHTENVVAVIGCSIKTMRITNDTIRYKAAIYVKGFIVQMGIELILALQGEGREGSIATSLCTPYTCLPQLGGIVM